jgi:hypothetical protein
VPITGDESRTEPENSCELLPSKRIGRSEWIAIIPEKDFETYDKAIKAIRPLGFPFLLGGAFGLACYTGRWRNTKDIDFFVMAAHHEAFVKAILKAGFVDYYDRLPYDRGWLFRAAHNGAIVDIIWDTPNRRSQVEEIWVARAVHVDFRGEPMLAVPPEELLVLKSFVLQKDRCDWTDLVNLLCFQAGRLDWEHVIWRYGPDLSLLRALLNVFAWVCPVEAAQIPGDIRSRLGIEIQIPDDPAATTRTRVNLLDSRPWFAAFHPMDAPLPT